MLQVRMLTTYATSLREEAEQGAPPPRVTYADDTAGAADLGSPSLVVSLPLQLFLGMVPALAAATLLPGPESRYATVM